jgi:hypothetical protein
MALAWRRGANVGIVAFCPQGHRVKVKDHLAGKKGVCPTCGTRFRIPLESEPEPPPAAALPKARVVSLEPAAIAALPRVLLAEETKQPVHEPPRATPAAAPPPPLPTHAALDERPDLAWSRAVPGGVAAAPMPAAELRAWLDSGTVMGNELVWRTDWQAWRPVGDVFPDAVRDAGKP